MIEQRYISKELTHFIGRRCPTDEARYDLLKLILGQGHLKANRIPGVEVAYTSQLMRISGGRLSDESGVQIQVVCFCDIPVSDLRIHMSKYGRFGISFPKQALLPTGANPVFYVAVDSQLPGNTVVPASTPGLLNVLQNLKRSEYLDRIWSEALSLSWDVSQRVIESKDEEVKSFMMRIYHLQQYWNQSVIAFIKPFRASESDDSDENYYMEREWRVSGDVHFGLSDVYRVIIPESFARRFREDFPNFFGQLSFVE